MKFINRLYKKYVDKFKISAQKRELERKKHFLDSYGAYRSAENLSRLEVLEILFKMFKKFGYEGPDLNEETNIATAIEQVPGGDADFDIIEELDKVLDFFWEDIKDKENEQLKTFGDLADLIIKKTKEKKQINATLLDLVNTYGISKKDLIRIVKHKLQLSGESCNSGSVINKADRMVIGIVVGCMFGHFGGVLFGLGVGGVGLLNWAVAAVIGSAITVGFGLITRRTTIKESLVEGLWVLLIVVYLNRRC